MCVCVCLCVWPSTLFRILALMLQPKAMTFSVGQNPE